MMAKEERRIALEKTRREFEQQEETLALQVCLPLRQVFTATSANSVNFFDKDTANLPQMFPFTNLTSIR